MKYIAILLSVLLTASQVWAAPVFDAASTTGAESVLSVSHNHISTGSNRFLISCVRVNDPATTVGSTYNSISTSPVANNIDGNNQRLYMRSLIAPSTGTNQHTVSAGDVVNIMVGVMTFTDTHQTTPLGTAIAQFPAGEFPPVSISPSSTTTDLIADCFAMGDSPDSTLGAGQAGRFDFNDASLGQLTGSTKAGAAGTTAMTRDWAGGSAQYISLIGVAIKEAAAGGGGVALRRIISE